MNMDKPIGRPLGHPANKGKGDAAPPGAGDEGGLGSYGDQRDKEVRPSKERNEPPLDGTLSGEDIEGDEDLSSSRAKVNVGPRLDMETRKREPLIIW